MVNTIKANDRYQYHEVCRTKSIRVVTNPFPDPDPYQGIDLDPDQNNMDPQPYSCFAVQVC